MGLRIGVSILGSVAFLAACGSSSSSEDDVTRILTGADALNFGTQSAAQSAGQLPFAGDPIDPSTDFNELKIVVARFISDEETGETVLQISEETAQNVDISEGELTGTMSLGGEITAYTDGEGIRSNGARIFIEEVRGENWSSLFNIYSYVYNDAPLSTGENTDGFFVVGFQTNPDSMPTSGGVGYIADLTGYATLLDQDGDVLENEVALSGTVDFFVNFEFGRISGTTQIEADVAEGVDVPFTPIATLLLDETDIVGNGFATSAASVSGCETGSICTSDSQFGGVFFGTAAEELSGIATVDYTELDAETGNGLQIIGAAGYLAEPGSRGGDPVE